MKRKGMSKLIIPISLVVALAIVVPFMSGCLPGQPSPVVEEPPVVVEPPVVEPPVVEEPDAYEEYVAGLLAGEFPVPREAFEQAMQEGKLALYNWAEWWPDEIHEGFAEEFGIEVTLDHFAGGDERVAKFMLYPEAPYDLVLDVSQDDFFPLREAGATREINTDWIPNMLEYIPERFAQMDSVAYCLYFPAYTYNTKYVDDPRIPSWAVLLEPMEEFKGKITLWDGLHEVTGAALKYLGYNWYSDDEAELMEARDLLMELKPYIMVFDSWPVPLLMGDEAWIIGGWYGDGWFFHDDYEAVLPALPAEGTKLGVGYSTHMIGSPNPAAAHLFLNYLHRPEVNALLIEAIVFVPTHTAVPELLSEEVLEKVSLPEGYLDKCDLPDPRAFTGKGLELRVAMFEEMRR